MRTRYGLLFLACLSLVCAPVAYVGCSSAQRTAYIAAKATHVTVQEAMRLWGAHVKQVVDSHPGAAQLEKLQGQEEKVKDAFDKYIASMKLVADTGRTAASMVSTNGPSTVDVLNALKANADRDLEDLVALLRSFGVKI